MGCLHSNDGFITTTFYTDDCIVIQIGRCPWTCLISSPHALFHLLPAIPYLLQCQCRLTIAYWWRTRFISTVYHRCYINFPRSYKVAIPHAILSRGHEIIVISRCISTGHILLGRGRRRLPSCSLC